MSMLASAIRGGGALLGLLSMLSICAPSVRAQSPTEFKLKWAGTVFDAFTFDGDEVWTVEDGGRIRHRNASGAWSFDTVQVSAQDQLLRISFIEQAGQRIGWAVGRNGIYMKLTGFGTSWGHPWQFTPAPANVPVEIWDVDFLDSQNGWLTTRHMVYRTDSGGNDTPSWFPLTFYRGPHQLTPAELAEINFYSLDVVPALSIYPEATTSMEVVALLVGEPGVIFRSFDGVVFHEVFDITSLCAGGSLPSCMMAICPTETNPPLAEGFEMWDVEISRHPTSPLALAVGGLGNSCGMIFRSTDHGTNWTSEPHECQCTGSPGCLDCSQSAAHNPHPDPSVNTETWHLREFNTLYSVSVFDGDNTAIAGGYSGQHVWRSTGGVWRDRSRATDDVVHAVGAITTPMFGTAAGTGSSSAGLGKGVIMGTAANIRRTTDGGDTWATEVPGDSWRIKDTFFQSASIGWVVGQHFRIAKTTFGGSLWDYVNPEPGYGGNNLLAICLNSAGNQGVAVGQANNLGGGFPDRPKILYLENPDSTPETWSRPASVSDISGTGSSFKELRAVEWAGDEQFWAAGETGLIYRSFNKGRDWRQWLPTLETWEQFKNFEIQGVAFRDTSAGIFVGSRSGAAAAYVWRDDGSGVSWTPIAPPTSTGALALNDVDVRGNVAYAVGTLPGGLGEVFVSNWSGTTFSQFMAVSHPFPFSPCAVGEDLGFTPALNRLEIAPGGRVWVGGECGRVYSYESGTWAPHKSQTDAHVRGISFPADNRGYFACQRLGVSGWSIVEYAP
jgi:photosystem II stability/assembly factor-like uncharacterized protein